MYDLLVLNIGIIAGTYYVVVRMTFWYLKAPVSFVVLCVHLFAAGEV